MEVTLDRAQLLSMADNAQLRSLLPALAQLQQKAQTKKKGCGCRAKQRSGVTDADVAQTKRQLASLLQQSESLRKAVKEALHADAVRIKYASLDKPHQTVVFKF